ncbi:MAG: redox-sensing transcriptional repressor Rex [Deltaproteobacteria bacterium]|nr:redox-sensing transcriptional repressor Rex [Deltaproteobacteria bacterium]
MGKKGRIPDATIERVAMYLRSLEVMFENGHKVISSENLADTCKVNPAQVRKDLSFFGEFGIRGVGYDVHDLLLEIKEILAFDRVWRLGIAGLDDMGMALVQHKNFLKRGYKFVAAFDEDKDKTGMMLPGGLKIYHIEEINRLSRSLNIEIGVITTSPTRAQDIAQKFFDSGIKAILNFAPIQIKTPDCCFLQNVDITMNLDHLVFQLNKINA